MITRPRMMRNDSRRTTSSSPYATAGGHRSFAWPALLIRMFIIVVPAQLLGFFIGGAVVSASGVLADRPELSLVINIVAGILSGLAVGLLLTPKARELVPFLVTCAVFGLLVVSVLVALGQLRLGARADPELGPLLLGALLTAVPQTLVAWGLWSVKRST